MHDHWRFQPVGDELIGHQAQFNPELDKKHLSAYAMQSLLMLLTTNGLSFK